MRRTAHADKGAEVAHRRVEYFFPVPASKPDQYLSLSFRALIAPSSDLVFCDTLVKLFDAVLRTIRWMSLKAPRYRASPKRARPRMSEGTL
ncbi:hypothetical protein HTV80_12530 [Streptomyces sp. Vc74B-19]|uniref:hypothetical protein n=1 Tax=Streptomyces sp. Vc74B-19 TaxID=2741324 RepID=UPI001BFC18B9|nr:hypothetical protein [Streptomyces sp. Vc74B-19]MBT3163934.1 hypothetical protein [Streptomyces sp. Vc74B-19]